MSQGARFGETGPAPKRTVKRRAHNGYCTVLGERGSRSTGWEGAPIRHCLMQIQTDEAGMWCERGHTETGTETAGWPGTARNLHERSIRLEELPNRRVRKVVCDDDEGVTMSGSTEQDRRVVRRRKKRREEKREQKEGNGSQILCTFTLSPCIPRSRPQNASPHARWTSSCWDGPSHRIGAQGDSAPRTWQCCLLLS